MSEIFSIWLLVGIIILGICLFILLVFYLRLKKQFQQRSSEELLYCLHTLDNIIQSYINNVFLLNLTILKSKYNLDPKSNVNSIKPYQNEFKKLLKRSSLDIIKYLSQNTYDSLLKYYSEDGLFLMILSKLQSVSK